MALMQLFLQHHAKVIKQPSCLVRTYTLNVHISEAVISFIVFSHFPQECVCVYGGWGLLCSSDNGRVTDWLTSRILMKQPTNRTWGVGKWAPSDGYGIYDNGSVQLSLAQSHAKNAESWSVYAFGVFPPMTIHSSEGYQVSDWRNPSMDY